MAARSDDPASNRDAGHAVEWQRALDDARHGLERQGRADSTIRRVLDHVHAYANATPELGPWDATPASLDRWLERFAGCGRTAIYSRRSSLRTFYRWAFAAGRVTSDPSAATVRTLQARTVPRLWHGPIQDYLQWLRAASESRETVRLRRAWLSRLALELPIADPWRVEYRDLAEWMARHRWGRETARAARSSLRSFYRWAVLEDRTEHDPAKELPPIRTAPGMRRPAAEDSYARAVSSAAPRERLMLRMAAELGMRRAEIARAHAFDLSEHPDGWWLDVHGKGEKRRTLPVPDDLARDLREQGSGWLFPGSIDGHLSVSHVGVLIGRQLPRGVSAHALRHRFATQAYGNTRNLLAVQLLLGHSSPTTTQRYVQVADTTLRATVIAARP